MVRHATVDYIKLRIACRIMLYVQYVARLVRHLVRLFDMR